MAIEQKKRLSRRWLFFLGFILVTYVILFGASYFFNKEIEFQFSLPLYFITAVIFWIGQPMNLIKKCFVIFLTFLIITFIGLALIFLTLALPGSKNHDYIMSHICLPAIDKYYENKKWNRASPANDKNAAGQTRWWVQHLECEENVTKGVGPMFSENPPGFPMIK